jgi:hypothetical protein
MMRDFMLNTQIDGVKLRKEELKEINKLCCKRDH